MTERQAYALDALVREVNDHAPTRSKASDGGRASSGHTAQNPNSDHEPGSDGIWTARDFTHDPTHGLSCDDLATRLVREFGTHPAMMSGSYIIWNGQIISFDRIKEGWREYDGANPHDKHLHLSVTKARAGFDSRRPWDLWKTPVKPVKVTRVTQARALLELAAKHAGPVRKAAIKAALYAIRKLDR